MKKVWAWIKKEVTAIVHGVAPAAVVITEEIKDALNSDSVGFLAHMIDKVFPKLNGLSEKVIADVNKLIPTVLGAELAVAGLPDNPTEADILAFEQKVLAAFKVTDNKSKLYTEVGAQVYGIIQADVNAGKKFTFWQLVKDVQKAYEDYQADLAEQQAEAQSAE